MEFAGEPSKKRKARVGFNKEKDLVLLRAALRKNPWHRGDKQWEQVVEEVKNEFQGNLTTRTVRGRVELLIKKLKSNELKYKSGVGEVEKSESDKLLRSVIEIQEEERAADNNFRKAAPILGTNLETESMGTAETEIRETEVEEIEVEDIENIQFEYVPYDEMNTRVGRNFSATQASSAKQRRLEREEADAERQKYCDEAISAGKSRPSRQRMTKEDILIEQRLELDIQIEKEKLKMKKQQYDDDKARETKRQEHELQMERAKFEFERETTVKKLEFEKEKLEFEKEKLAVEKMREIRKEKEALRRDEIAQKKIEFQSKCIELISKLVEK